MNWRQRACWLRDCIPALWLALKEPATPWPAKMLAAVTVAYALSPIDLIPDFIPVLGMLDDLILLPALAALTIRFIPPSVMEECRTQAAHLWDDKKPKSWIYALPVILVWVLIIWWIIYLLF